MEISIFYEHFKHAFRKQLIWKSNTTAVQILSSIYSWLSRCSTARESTHLGYPYEVPWRLRLVILIYSLGGSLKVKNNQSNSLLFHLDCYVLRVQDIIIISYKLNTQLLLFKTQSLVDHSYTTFLFLSGRIEHFTHSSPLDN